MIYNGKQYGHKILAMDLLGPSLEYQQMRRAFLPEDRASASRPNKCTDIFCDSIYFNLRYVVLEYLL